LAKTQARKANFLAEKERKNVSVTNFFFTFQHEIRNEKLSFSLKVTYLGDEVSEKVDGEGENADGLDVLEVDDHLDLAGENFLVLGEPGSHT
jgi:hypothetical protein